ncbi:hypothetical protein [Melittangium boletus]|uniref:hypothetical protein n=1 Tax=Melittangium boletus TaxID=83453 RepID=UPI003DA441A6
MASAASADTLDILGPSAAVAPEGFSIALVRRDDAGAVQPVGEVALRVTGARWEAGPEQPPLRTFLLVPQADAREVRVVAEGAAGRAEARYALGPPATRVSLTVEPPTPVKGRDTEARLTVRMLQADGTPEDSGSPPVLAVNVGRVEALARSAPGTWTARYVLPDTRYPEVAVLVALSAWPHPQSIHGAYGKALVPLAAAVDLPGRTEPNVQLSVTLADRTFGPVKTGADGRFRLPIVVPPGHETAQASAVDAAGNVRRSRMSLGLPPTDGLACVLHPTRLPADGVSQARLLCATSDALGQPVQRARVDVSARHGSLRGPTRAEGGLFEWIYTAPRALPATPERLVALWPERGASSRDERPLSLERGPVTRATLEPLASVLHAGSSTRVRVRAWDADGQPVSGARALARVSVGTLDALEEEAPGVLVGTWRVPAERGSGEASLDGVAYGPAATEPARLRVWAEAGELIAAVTDLAGLPVGGQSLRVGSATVVTDADGTARLGPVRPGRLEVVHAAWPGLRRTVDVVAEGGPVFPREAPMPRARVEARVRLAPAVPVNVRLQVEGARVTYWMEDAEGRVVAGRAAYVWLSEGERGPVEVKDGRTSFVVTGATRVSVSVADVATGVTALAEVRP